MTKSFESRPPPQSELQFQRDSLVQAEGVRKSGRRDFERPYLRPLLALATPELFAVEGYHTD